MKNAAAIAYIRELCSLGLAGELLIPSVLEAMHRVIPSARNLFDWVNAEGSIQRYYFEGPIDHAVARLYFGEFHNRREAEAMPRYVDVIRGEATIRSAEELNTRHFFDSALYQEIWRPQRLHYRLEAIVRGRDRRPLGSLVLYRESNDPIFSQADEQLLQTLVPYVAHGLQQGKQRSVDYIRSDRRSALVNLDVLGRIVQMSRNAHKVLLLAHGEISPASAAQTPTSQNFPTLSLIHSQLSRRTESVDTPFSLSLHNAWGRFDFHGERLESPDGDGGAGIGITIQHLVPREVRERDQLEALALSITQKKVCALLLQGQSHARIADQLGISVHTANDHVRKIYQRLDVHSIDELRSRLGADTPP